MIKCVVWDLDNTVWDNILLEDREVVLKDKVKETIVALDHRGILQSIASKNEHELAIQKLEEFGLKECFLYPQISWNSKVEAIRNIARSLNIGLDAIAFIDDQVAEIDEVKFSLPEVVGIAAKDIDRILSMPIMQPRFATEDLKNRRKLYLTDMERKKAEDFFVGSKEEFLASLKMTLTIFPAREGDLQRAEELTVRTHQLNATGYTYSYEELKNVIASNKFILWVAQLDDRYGPYGHIGLALIECQEGQWTIKLLLMSCRVMTRGVGTALLSHIMQQAKGKKVRLLAEFLPTDRNRMMNITYRLAGFSEVAREGKVEILEHHLETIPGFPDYLKVVIN